MIQTLPLSHTHRDLVHRVIRQGDVVVWTNRKQGMGLVLCRVESSTVETVRISTPDGRLTNVTPANLLVVTHQIERNLAGNVGINRDLEATR